MDREQTKVATGPVRGRRALFVRRGLVALAAGVLAGVSTKFSERTVQAANGDNLIVGNVAAPGAQTSTATTQLDGAVNNGQGTLRVSNTLNRAINASTVSSANAIVASSAGGAAIFASSSGNAGIWGSATNSFGLLGTSTNSTGLYGSSAGSSPGLYGVSAGGIGVRGDSGINPTTTAPNGNVAAAVLGNAIGGDGVQGTTTSGFGVRGQSTSSTGVYGMSNTGTGVYGTSTSSAGVWGNSTNSIGVYGVGSTGVLGQSASGTAVTATTTNGVAIQATGRSRLHGDVEVGDFTANPPGTAFNLNVTGELRVNGQKAAIVRGADGDFRTFYCLEAAESYFEDFGTAKLSGGSVRVNIDEEFRQFVAPERGLYIQLTPLGPSNGLYVGSPDVLGFEIREANGGASNIDVQYRIVARRRDVEGSRLKRVKPDSLRSHEKPVSVEIVTVPADTVRQNTERRHVEIAPPPTPPERPADLPEGPGQPERRGR